MTPSGLPVEDIIGYPVTTLSREQLRAVIGRWLDDPPAEPCVFACANPHSLHMAHGDPAFHAALQQADLLTPDGIGIVIGSKLLGGRIRERVTGYDVFEDTCCLLEERGGSVFFLGSTEQVLELVSQRILRDWPGLRVAGACSPPFRAEFTAEENAAMVAEVNAARPDVLWVGMTAPKQEKWIAQNANKLDVRFVGAIGAVFDFYAGTVPRSPVLFQKFGLEWLPRLIRQPRRLWKRNFVSNPAFLARTLRARIRSMF